MQSTHTNSVDPTSGLWPVDARERPALRNDGVIEWARVPITPLPEVREDNSESAWDRAIEAGVFHPTGESK